MSWYLDKYNENFAFAILLRKWYHKYWFVFSTCWDKDQTSTL